MLRNLIQTGNSKALILTKDMRDHLGIEDEVEVEFRRGSIVLRHPEVPDEDAAPEAKKAKVKNPDGGDAKAKEKSKAPKEEKAKEDKAKDEKAKEEKVKVDKVKVKAVKAAKVEKPKAEKLKGKDKGKKGK